MNKKIISFLFVIMLLFVAMPAFCTGEEETMEETNEVTSISTTKAATSTVLATVNLTQSKTITQDDVDSLISTYTEQGYDVSQISTEELLEYLIQQEILMQAYEKAGYVDSEGNMTEETVNGVLNYFIYLLSQDGYSFETIDDFNAFLQENSIDINEVILSYAPEYLTQLYLSENYSDILTDVQTPTDEDIRSFYSENSTAFTNSEKVKIAHILFYVNDEASKATVKAKADSVYNQIKKGTLTFEKAVTTYSDDTDSNSNGGLLGWVNKTESDFEQLVGITPDVYSEYHKYIFGENTYNALFNYDDGEITPVLESPFGYHIFKIVNHQSPKTLTITDKIYPEVSATVYDFLGDYIAYLYTEVAAQNAETQMMNDLLAETTITY